MYVFTIYKLVIAYTREQKKSIWQIGTTKPRLYALEHLPSFIIETKGQDPFALLFTAEFCMDILAFYLGKHTAKGILCFGGGQPASAVSVVLISMYLILSILVDTFFSKISLTMLPAPKPHNTACVLS